MPSQPNHPSLDNVWNNLVRRFKRGRSPSVTSATREHVIVTAKTPRNANSRGRSAPQQGEPLQRSSSRHSRVETIPSSRENSPVRNTNGKRARFVSTDRGMGAALSSANPPTILQSVPLNQGAVTKYEQRSQMYRPYEKPMRSEEPGSLDSCQPWQNMGFVPPRMLPSKAQFPFHMFDWDSSGPQQRGGGCCRHDQRRHRGCGYDDDGAKIQGFISGFPVDLRFDDGYRGRREGHGSRRRRKSWSSDDHDDDDDYEYERRRRRKPEGPRLPREGGRVDVTAQCLHTCGTPHVGQFGRKHGKAKENETSSSSSDTDDSYKLKRRAKKFHKKEWKRWKPEIERLVEERNAREYYGVKGPPTSVTMPHYPGGYPGMPGTQPFQADPAGYGGGYQRGPMTGFPDRSGGLAPLGQRHYRPDTMPTGTMPGMAGPRHRNFNPGGAGLEEDWVDQEPGNDLLNGQDPLGGMDVRMEQLRQAQRGGVGVGVGVGGRRDVRGPGLRNNNRRSGPGHFDTQMPNIRPRSFDGGAMGGGGLGDNGANPPDPADSIDPLSPKSKPPSARPSARPSPHPSRPAASRFGSLRGSVRGGSQRGGGSVRSAPREQPQAPPPEPPPTQPEPATTNPPIPPEGFTSMAPPPGMPPPGMHHHPTYFPPPGYRHSPAPGALPAMHEQHDGPTWHGAGPGGPGGAPPPPAQGEQRDAGKKEDW